MKPVAKTDRLFYYTINRKNFTPKLSIVSQTPDGDFGDNHCVKFND